MVIAVVSVISGTVIVALVFAVCRIVVLSVMVVRCIGTGCRIVRLSTIVMIVGGFGTGGWGVCLPIVVGIAAVVGSPVVVGCVSAGCRVVGIAATMSGSVVVGAVLLGSRMLGIGTYAVRSIGKYIAVLVVACGTLVQHSVLICITVCIAERGCAGFQTLIALGKVIIFILRTGYKCNG